MRKKERKKSSIISLSCDPFLANAKAVCFTSASCLSRELAVHFYDNEDAINAAEQNREREKSLKHDNLTVPAQLVPAQSLWCHLQ